MSEYCYVRIQLPFFVKCPEIRSGQSLILARAAEAFMDSELISTEPSGNSKQVYSSNIDVD